MLCPSAAEFLTARVKHFLLALDLQREAANKNDSRHFTQMGKCFTPTCNILRTIAPYNADFGTSGTTICYK